MSLVTGDAVVYVAGSCLGATSVGFRARVAEARRANAATLVVSLELDPGVVEKLVGAGRAIERSDEILMNTTKAQLTSCVAQTEPGPPKNQPHGPEHKGRGGKVKRW